MKKAVAFTIISILIAIILGGGGYAYWQITTLIDELAESRKQTEIALGERNTTRLAEGLSWMYRAKESEKESATYPDCLLYAAKAIGYVGQGDVGESEIALIREKEDPAEFSEAVAWLAERKTYRPIWASNLGGPVSSLAVSTHGRYLLAGGEKSSKMWDYSSAPENLDLPSAKSVAIHPQTKQIALATGSELAIFQENKETRNYKSDVVALAYNLSGSQLAGARSDGTVFLLGKKDAEEIGKVEGGEVTQLAFDPKNATLAALVKGKGMRLFFLNDKGLHPFWANHQSAATAFAFHPDPMAGVVAIGNEDGSIEIRRLFDGKLISTAVSGSGEVSDLSFREDGKRLASASVDGLVRLWNTETDTPQFIASLNSNNGPATAVAYLADGDSLATGGSDGSLSIWDVSDTEKSPQDLYNYIKEGWYVFDPQSKRTKWNGGEAFLNLPEDSLLSAWQKGDQKSKGGHVKNLVGASLLGIGTKEIEAILNTKMDLAKKSSEWTLLDLLNQQMAMLSDKTPATAKPPVVEKKNFTNGAGGEMIWCKPGKFLMGELDGPDFARQFEVTLSRGFWMGKHEVTQAIYQSVMDTNPSKHHKSGATAPAENFNWFDAREFCQKLTAIEQARGLVPVGWEYKIPTEAQWEYVCRAGKGTQWSFGDSAKQLAKFANFNDKRGNFEPLQDKKSDDGHQFTAPVGSFQANAWGFHDLHGNVFEWCRDAMDTRDPNYPLGPETDPFTDIGNLRTLRGGSYKGTADECRSAYRDANNPLVPSEAAGLRVVLVRKK